MLGALLRPLWRRRRSQRPDLAPVRIRDNRCRLYLSSSFKQDRRFNLLNIVVFQKFLRILVAQWRELSLATFSKYPFFLQTDLLFNVHDCLDFLLNDRWRHLILFQYPQRIRRPIFRLSPSLAALNSFSLTINGLQKNQK